jgi:hypothetical protein
VDGVGRGNYDPILSPATQDRALPGVSRAPALPKKILSAKDFSRFFQRIVYPPPRSHSSTRK